MRCLNCNKEGIPRESKACPHCGEPVALMFTDMLPPGTLLNNGVYRIEHAVGQGGFGITYRATDTNFDQPVAIKEFFLKGTSRRDSTTGMVMVKTVEREGVSRARDKFIREGRLLGSISSQNVVRVKYLFEENDTAYLVMEYLEGRSLREVQLAQEAKSGSRRFPDASVREIVGDIVEALASVHAAGILHLDIKPANIMLVPDAARGAGRERAVLIDFGAGRQDTGDSLHTTSIYLTPQYAPPELVLRQRSGTESDIFLVGMLVHELAMGSLPPPVMERLASDRFDSNTVPVAWRSLVSSALIIDAAARPKDIRQWWKSPPVAPIPAPAPAPQTTVNQKTSAVVKEAPRKAKKKRRAFAPTFVACASLCGVAWLWYSKSYPFVPAAEPSPIVTATPLPEDLQSPSPTPSPLFTPTPDAEPTPDSEPTPDPDPIPTPTPDAGTASEETASLSAETPSLPPVSLDLRDAPIRACLEQLFAKAHVQYQIDPRISGYATVNIKDQPFENALKLILRSSLQPITYTKESGVYIIRVRENGGM